MRKGSPVTPSQIGQHLLIWGILLLGIIFLVVLKAAKIEPVHRDFRLDDPSISHPHAARETFPNLYLIIYMIVLPAFVIILEFILERCSFRHAYRLVLSFAVGCILMLLMTKGIKYTTGRLRPDFLARCQVNTTGLTSSEMSQLKEWNCTHTNLKEVSRGRRSFPSGHSSQASFVGLFVTLVLCRRFCPVQKWLRMGPRDYHTLKSFLQYRRHIRHDLNRRPGESDYESDGGSYVPPLPPPRQVDLLSQEMEHAAPPSETARPGSCEPHVSSNIAWESNPTEPTSPTLGEEHPHPPKVAPSPMQRTSVAVQPQPTSPSQTPLSRASPYFEQPLHPALQPGPLTSNRPGVVYRWLFTLYIAFLPYYSAIWIGISRTVDRVHHPTDVLAGLILGSALAYVSVAMVLDRLDLIPSVGTAKHREETQ